MSNNPLHTILAVAGTLKTSAERQLRVLHAVFVSGGGKFKGFHKAYAPRDAEPMGEHFFKPSETQKVETTVAVELRKLWDGDISKLIDLEARKEQTNQTASAQIWIDGWALTPPLAALTLLGLEKTIEDIIKVYEDIPTLSLSEGWKSREHEDGWYITTEANANVTRPLGIPIFEGNEHHPPQFEIIKEPTSVGIWTTTRTSGELQPSRKAALLSRLRQLLRATKEARQRANCAEVVEVNIAETLYDFIHQEQSE